MYIHPWEARGLSPREAARIQTFPDDFILKGAQNSWYALSQLMDELFSY